MINQKINYNEIFKKEIEEISKLDKKPTLLLHACCGPCLTYPLSILKDYFNVTVAYFNPNIFPKEEYEKRYQTLMSFVSRYAKDIKVVTCDYNHEIYLNKVKGYEKEKKAGKDVKFVTP